MQIKWINIASQGLIATTTNPENMDRKERKFWLMFWQQGA